MRTACILICLAAAMAGGAECLAGDTVVEVRYHGNFSIPDDEMARLARVPIGTQLSENSLEEIKERLMRTRRFSWVEVSKRSRTLSNTGDVVLIITVKEKPPLKSRLMFMPILSGSDEYGFTYGGRLTAINFLGAKERISFPLTWGGVRRAAVEGQRDFSNALISSFSAGTGISRKENPHFKLGDLRREAWGSVTRRFKNVQLDWDTGWTGVDFGPLSDSFITYGAEIALDTRQNINLPRNAIFAGFGWERMTLLHGGPGFNRYKWDFRGYKGLFGQSILAGQLFYHSSDGRLPDYQRPFLGGAATLRGEKPGAFIGDNLVLGTIELRLPLSSKLAVYQAGMDFFLDSGAVFDHGQTLGGADVKHGAGVGFFVFVAGFGLKVDFAYNLRDNFRIHFSTRFRF